MRPAAEQRGLAVALQLDAAPARGRDRGARRAFASKPVDRAALFALVTEIAAERARAS